MKRSGDYIVRLVPVLSAIRKSWYNNYLMIKPEYSEGHGFATAGQLERLHCQARRWLCAYGSRQFLASEGLITATIPMDTLEAGAHDAVDVLGVSGDLTLRYTVGRTEPLAGSSASIHHAGQTDFAYQVASQDRDIVEQERVYVGLGPDGIFGVRDRVYRPEYAHLAGSMTAPRAMDFVDGSIVGGRMTDLPDMSVEPDHSHAPQEAPAVGLVSLSGVKRCFRRVRDMVLADYDPDMDDELRDLLGPTEDERMLELIYDTIRLSTQEAAALEALVGTVAPRGRRGRSIR